MKPALRIAITGATGLLGSNLLFEILKQHLGELDSIEIFVLGRRGRLEISLKDRIEALLGGDGLDYIGAGPNVAVELMDRVQCVEIDLDNEDLGLAGEDFARLGSAPIDWFFHGAAVLDFRSTLAVLRNANVEGTRRVLGLVSQLKIGEFSYVGTAYACGSMSGHIDPGGTARPSSFRNYYEETKFDAQLLVRDFCKCNRIRWRSFRPSIICGRLIEQPLGAISKFDVFYKWAAFFLYLKSKQVGIARLWDAYDLKMRVCYNPNRALNIVPVDYAAKVMYQVCAQSDCGESYHLVNPEDTPHHFYITRLLEAIGIEGIVQVNRVPQDQTTFERPYYRTVGKDFTPYTTAENMEFDRTSVLGVLKKAGLECPRIDEANMGRLIAYAKERNFGVSL